MGDMRRVFIIHGWGGSPSEGWFPWLKKELEKKGYRVFVPAMPNPETPVIAHWVDTLRDLVGEPDEHTYFVGHSIGCQTILRYLETLPQEKKIRGAVFVAGWFTLMNLEEEEQPIAKPWLETPMDFEKIKRHAQNFFAVFSDNDPLVPPENKEMFQQRLGARVIVEQGKGHFSGDDGITHLPSALESILKL